MPSKIRNSLAILYHRGKSYLPIRFLKNSHSITEAGNIAARANHSSFLFERKLKENTQFSERTPLT